LGKKKCRGGLDGGFKEEGPFLREGPKVKNRTTIRRGNFLGEFGIEGKLLGSYSSRGFPIREEGAISPQVLVGL